MTTGPKKTRTLYIGGFGTKVTADELRALCNRHGRLEDLRLVSRGAASFAYATFADIDEAVMACRALDGSDLRGHTLRVAYAV